MRPKTTTVKILLILLLFLATFLCFAILGYVSRVYSSRSSNYFDSRWDHFAIALKTGKDVALTRTPLQLLSFLKTVRHKIIIGDGPNVTIGEYEMIDVYTNLPYLNHDSSNNQLNDFPQDVGPEKTPTAAESVPDADSIGWKSDAHKNLPGFKLLYQTFPHADWYIMIDDDTYLIKRNLDHLLKRYNPSLPFYFGAATMFVGCDNVRRVGDGPKFAHGGSGIVISKGAMKKMMENIDECTVKYKDCWAGDVRTALCLRDSKILLQGIPGFNGSPPNQKFGFGSPCSKPITFHHLLPYQIQLLAKLENDKHSSNFITMADVFQASAAKISKPINNTDIYGGYITSIPGTTLIACELECIRRNGCTSYVLSETSTCWLKEGIPPAYDKKGFTSGVIASKFVCPNDQ